MPAFAGLGAPHWDQYARGTIAGITRGTTAAHFARAALDCIAFQVADLVDVFNADAQTPIAELRVDGGAAKNDLLLQFQADLLRLPAPALSLRKRRALGARFRRGWGWGFGKVRMTSNPRGNWIGGSTQGWAWMKCGIAGRAGRRRFRGRWIGNLLLRDARIVKMGDVA